MAHVNDLFSMLHHARLKKQLSNELLRYSLSSQVWDWYIAGDKPSEFSC